MSACPHCKGERTLAGRKLIANRRHKARHTTGLKTGKSWCSHPCHWPSPTPAPAPAPVARQVDPDPDASGRRVCTPDGEPYDPDDGRGP